MAGFVKMIFDYHKKNKVRAENYDFFKACMAAAALIAAADGKADKRERAGLKILVKTLEDLKLYNASIGTELFDEFIDRMNDSPEEGRAEIMTVIEAVKDDAEWASLLLAVTATISASDGVVDEREAEIIDNLCELLGIDRSAIEAFSVDTRGAEYD